MIKEMKSRKSKLIDFLDGLYIPSGLEGFFENARKCAVENDYASIDETMEGQMYEGCLIIETKGKGVYETFKGYSITRVDVGRVSPTMADIAVYDVKCGVAKPMKVRRGNVRINIPVKKGE